MKQEKIPFHSLSFEELKNWLEERSFKGYAAEQIYDWVYQKRVYDFFQMFNLKKELREELGAHFLLPSLSLVKTEESKSGEVTKFLWKLRDGKRVESVLIRSHERRTVCVSSQVGCNARCAFCASGKSGRIRQLDSAEIMEQVLLIDSYLREKNERVSHVVFMGMGEPLENYEEVIRAIRRLIHPRTLNLSQRKITISTVGITEQILRLKEEGLKINLVLSLHAPSQHVRKKIIPYARKYPLEEILDAMESYASSTKRDITYEYILIDQINAEISHAKELAKLLQKKQCTVNLIPYNPVQGLNLKRPEKEKVEAFRRVLLDAKIPVTWRYTKGKDIEAACGQLALKQEESLLKQVG